MLIQLSMISPNKMGCESHHSNHWRQMCVCVSLCYCLSFCVCLFVYEIVLVHYVFIKLQYCVVCVGVSAIIVCDLSPSVMSLVCPWNILLTVTHSVFAVLCCCTLSLQCHAIAHCLCCDMPYDCTVCLYVLYPHTVCLPCYTIELCPHTVCLLCFSMPSPYPSDLHQSTAWDANSNSSMC